MFPYYGLRLGLFIASYVPRSVGYAICAVLGRLFWIFNREGRGEVERSLRNVLGSDASDAEMRRISREVFLNLTVDYYDLLLLKASTWPQIESLVHAECLDRITRERDERGRGMIVVFFHMSGFNLVSQAARMGPWKAWVVAESLQPPRLRRLVNSMRSAQGVPLIEVDLRGTRNMLRALRRNEVLVIAGDRDVTGTGVPVSFLGRVATLPTGAAVLALRTGATILPVLSCRLPDKSVHLRIVEPIVCPETGVFDTDVRNITQSIARVFEDHVSHYPDQWVVSQFRWSYE